MSDIRILSLTAFTVVLLSVVFSVVTDCNIFNVWRWNLQNHEGFYGAYVRTWWKWLLANPIELCLAVSPVIFISATIGVRTVVSKTFGNTTAAFSSTNMNASRTTAALIQAMAITFVLLWLSGKNQGEAARLWCFLTPWLLLSAGVVWNKYNATFTWLWPPVLILQLVYCIAFVSRVNGFSF